METRQAIQSTANVVRITTIKTGDVYKRFDANYDDRVFFGLVTQVHNDGKNTIIEATEYRYSYSSLEVDYKVLRGEKDYILFPSSPEELNLELDKAKNSSKRKLEEAEANIIKEQKLLKEIEGLISGETQKKLKAMSYKELSQAKYNELSAQI